MKFLPEGYKFAFTIVDDTDDSRIENIRPVYDFLTDLNIYVTKTVWPLACPEGSPLFFAGSTMEDVDYLSYVKELQQRGFEIALHNATMETSDRSRTQAGFEFMQKNFGSHEWLHCNHGNNSENIYWGGNRFSLWLYKQFGHHLFYRGSDFKGEDEESRLFWGDICRERVKYVRSFTFSELNLFEITKNPVYRLNQTPYVKNWFITSDAADVNEFSSLVNRASLETLIDQGGVCILSTHLGKGFCRNGVLDPKFEDTMKYIALQGGWYAPASIILDALKDSCQDSPLSNSQRVVIETKFIAKSITRKLYGS